jgi:AcrR family transcriptional regulator
MLAVIAPDRQTPPARERMIVSAALLLREKGLTGTSFGDVIEHSGAPRGSIYHHFPDGKEQLVEEAVRYAGDYIAASIDRAARSGDPLAALREFTTAWRTVLAASDFRAGCPVVAVAVEAHDDDSALTAAASEAFARWQTALARLLRDRGLTPARSRRLATTAVAALEGAVVLCRASRDLQPLTDVGDELEAMIGLALREAERRPEPSR